MSMSKTLRWTAVLGAVIILGIAAVSAGTADAAKGGASSPGGKGGKNTPTPTPSTATVVLVSANPVPLGTAPSFHASGYKPGDYILFQMSRYVRVDGVYADATGSANYTFYQPMTLAGSFTMTTTLLNGVNQASVTFNVQ